MNRRSFLKTAAGVAAAGALGVVTYGRVIEPAAVQVVEREIPIAGLDARLDGLRAAQLSDLHMGRWFTEAHLKTAVSVRGGKAM